MQPFKKLVNPRTEPAPLRGHEKTTCSTGGSQSNLRSVARPEKGPAIPAVGLVQGNQCSTENRSFKDYPVWPFNDWDFPDRQQNVTTWLQTVGLSKQQDYPVPPSVKSVQMGLGWDRGVDVDASVALFDKNHREVDIVWYKKLQSTCGSISHGGDNLTGVGDGDDERISVQLTKIPLHVHYLLFAVCIFSSGVSFRNVRAAYVRMLSGEDKNSEMCHFPLEDMSGHAMLMGLLTRKGASWSFKALGTPATGRTIKELLQNPRNLSCLSESQSSSPELRCVEVTVIKGVDLAAKDRSFWSGKEDSSDPYFVIRFKDKTFRSEYKAKTLNPQWKSAGFDLGCITEVETNPLTIEVFDYDTISSDDFMGMVQVPGSALFSLGPGEHTYWFQLSDSNRYKGEAVSGKILVSISVEANRPEPRLV